MRTGRHMVVGQKLVSALRSSLVKPSRKQGRLIADESPFNVRFLPEQVETLTVRQLEVSRGMNARNAPGTPRTDSGGVTSTPSRISQTFPRDTVA